MPVECFAIWNCIVIALVSVGRNGKYQQQQLQQHQQQQYHLFNYYYNNTQLRARQENKKKNQAYTERNDLAIKKESFLYAKRIEENKILYSNGEYNKNNSNKIQRERECRKESKNKKTNQQQASWERWAPIRRRSGE